MTKLCTSILKLIDKINPCWPSISEIRLEARKKGIWKEVQLELRKQYRIKKRASESNCHEPHMTESEKLAHELVQSFLYSEDENAGDLSYLRKDAKNRGLKWSYIQREFRRIRHERDAKLGEALSRNERILDVKYPHWEIGYERGMSDAWDERYLRIETAVEDMMDREMPIEKICYYTDLSRDEVQKIIKSLKNRKKAE